MESTNNHTSSGDGKELSLVVNNNDPNNDLNHHYSANEELQKNSSDGSSVNNKESSITLDDAIEHCGFGMFQIKLLLVAGFCWMSESMEMMILSVLSPALRCEWDLKGYMEASITTAVFVGMLIGAVLWGAVSDRWGRRFGFLATSVFTFVFGFASTFAPDIYTMLVFRALVGMGVGGGHTSFTLFAEYLPRKGRATCLVLIELFWTAGTIGEAGLAWLIFPRMDPNISWRVLLAVSAVPTAILILAYPIVPESARFLLQKGREADALKLVQQISKDNNTPLKCDRLIYSAGQKKSNIFDVLVPALRKTTILLWIIWFANAFVYYGVVLMSTSIFQLAEQPGGRCGDGGWIMPLQPHHNQTHTDTAKCSPLTNSDYEQIFITSAAELPGIVFTVFIIDRIGRKNTQAMEFLLTSVFILLVSFCLDFGTTVVVFTIRGLITGAFQASYVYTPEVYPTTVRSTALGLCSTMARIGGIVTPYVAQVFFNISPYLSLGFYSFFSFSAAVASFLLPIETAGRGMVGSVEEYEEKPEKIREKLEHNSEKTPLLRNRKN